MLSLDGDGAQTVSQILKGSQFLAAKALHGGKTPSHICITITVKVVGLFHCFDILSLDIVKNAMYSLMDTRLLSRSFNDGVEGKDTKEKLVTVSDRPGLQRVSDVLAMYVLPEVCGFDSNLTPAKL